MEGLNRVTARQNCYLKEVIVGSGGPLRPALWPDAVAAGETAEQTDAARLEQNRRRQSRMPTSAAYEAVDLRHTPTPTGMPTSTTHPAEGVNNSDRLTELQVEAVEAAKAAEAALVRAKAAAAAVKQAKRDAEALIDAANQEASAAMQNMQEATHKAGMASEAAAPSGSDDIGSAVFPKSLGKRKQCNRFSQ